MIFMFNGSVIYGTAALVVFAFVIRYLAVGWNGAALALRGLDRDLSDAGRLSGAGGWKMLWHVQWPQIAPQVAEPCGLSGVAMLVHTLRGQPSCEPRRSQTSGRSRISDADRLFCSQA